MFLKLIISEYVLSIQSWEAPVGSWPLLHRILLHLIALNPPCSIPSHCAGCWGPGVDALRLRGR